ncbi:hypothetical protein SEA_SHAGRAT_33 [Rhodococcus phage Shagrat]|nr:hypothetical protein SEA_SHAGRAT_33 [Rhodococcus phage Shagrat]
MKAIRVDVDGTVDLLDLQKGPEGTHLADLRKALNGAWVEHVNCGEVGRFTSKVKHPNNWLSMWVDDEGALGASGLQVNMLAMGMLQVIGLRLGQNLYGPIVFTETDPEKGETSLQPETAALLQGILHRLTVDNLDILADQNKARKYHAVMHGTGRTGIEILDTSDLDDVRAIGFHPIHFPGGDHVAEPLDDAKILADLGWERTGPWEDASWLYEGEETTDLIAPIRKK